MTDMITCKNNYGQEVTLPADTFSYRPSVYIMLVRDGQILVGKNKSNGGLWFPGGGVEGDESYEVALRREVKEETGITDFDILREMDRFENYFYYEPEDLRMQAEIIIYSGTTSKIALKSNQEVDDEETFDFIWIDPDDLTAKHFSDFGDRFIQLLQTL